MPPCCDKGWNCESRPTATLFLPLVQSINRYPWLLFNPVLPGRWRWEIASLPRLSSCQPLPKANPALGRGTDCCRPQTPNPPHPWWSIRRIHHHPSKKKQREQMFSHALPWTAVVLPTTASISRALRHRDAAGSICARIVSINVSKAEDDTSQQAA
jgi:hypothetical protein